MFLADLCLSIAGTAVAADGGGEGDDGGGGDASVIDCYCCVQWQLDFFLSHFTKIHSLAPLPLPHHSMRDPHY